GYRPRPGDSVMPCPLDSGNDRPETGDRDASGDGGIDRREFMKSALAIGGAGPLASIARRYGRPERGTTGQQRVTVADRKNRQHAWDAYETYDEANQMSLPPAHHLLLHVDLVADGPPSPDDRREVAAAFRHLEEAFDWHHEGVLFTVGYSLPYFRRYDEPLPPGLDPDVDPTDKPGLLGARTLIDADGVTLPHERPVVADDYDACIHLASDHVHHLLAAEAALWGEEPSAGGVEFDATLDGVFTRPEQYPARRVGFAGHDNVVSNLEEDTDFDAGQIPGTRGDEDDNDPRDDEPEAPLSMGFEDQYANSIPRETHATMLEDQRLVDPKPPGVFAQGTIQHVSKLDIDLSGWYADNDADERRERMFSPHHNEGNTGTIGERLGNSNAPGNRPMRDVDSRRDDVAELTERDAETRGVTGHAQKTARARFDIQSRITEDGQQRLSGGEELLPADEEGLDLPGHRGDQEAEPVLLRRDVDTTDQARPGNHFVALMRFNPYMAYMRRAMNGVAFDTASFGLDGDGRIQHDAVGAGEDSGIVGYLETQRRGNYLVPPITLRALPHPRAEEVDVTVERDGDAYVVTVAGVDADALAADSVRFGWYYDVNRGRGATPARSTTGADSSTFEFPAAETGIDAAPGGPDGDVRVRLFAKREATLRPLRGTATVSPSR
ncbi:MAG: hypothetical protein ABEH83_12680, partial [Halobacterium sp.]